MKSITIHAVQEEFEKVHQYIESELNNRKISRELSLETMLVFEAIFSNILNQVSSDTDINVSVKNNYGHVIVRFDYIGSMYIPDSFENESLSPEDSIIDAYADKLSYRYNASHNYISLSVKRGPGKIFASSIIAMAIALVFSFIVRGMTSYEHQLFIIREYFRPIGTAYSGLILMIGAPITFFTLLSNLTDIYVFSEQSSLARILQNKSFYTSIISILLAVVFFYLFSPVISSNFGALAKSTSASFINLSFADFLKDAVPNNFFDAFLGFNPMPLIIVSLFIVYAFCTSGKYLSSFKKFIEDALLVFSKMINPLMYVIPAFCFLAMVEVILTFGFSALRSLMAAFIAMILGMVLMIVFYIIRLLIARINVIDFTKKLLPSLKENFAINSTTDAVSYNIRYCSRTYGLNRKFLESALPVLAKINLDGNCFIIMFNALFIAYITGLNLTLIHIFLIAFVVFFLSIGAPNPPGSIFIAILIITHLLNLPDMVALCVFSEVLIGPIQNMINVIGDVVTVEILDKELKKKNISV